VNKHHIKIVEERKYKFKLTKLELLIEDLPVDLENYHMVQFSDPHYGVYTSPAVIDAALKIISELDPNVLLLTGDYVHVGRENLRILLYKTLGPKLSKYAHQRRLARFAAQEFGEKLETLNPPDGIFGVWGNHDYLEGKRALLKYLPKKIQWLENDARQIQIGKEHILIGGLDDYRFGKPDINKLIDKVNTLNESSEVRILLSHNPDTVLLPDSTKLEYFNLMLSGHTHGGQICLPGSIPLITETKQKNHLSGLGKFGSLSVYTSNGVGCSGLPLRLFCLPEIVSIKLGRV